MVRCNYTHRWYICMFEYLLLVIVMVLLLVLMWVVEKMEVVLRLRWLVYPIVVEMRGSSYLVCIPQELREIPFALRVLKLE